MYVEENVTRSSRCSGSSDSVTSDMLSTAKPNLSPALRSISTLPAAFLPKVKFSPTTTSSTCRSSTSSSWI